MQHKHGGLKSHRIHRPIGAAGAGFDNLDDAGIAKAAQHFAVFMAATGLREIEPLTKYTGFAKRLEDFPISPLRSQRIGRMGALGHRLPFERRR